MTAIDKPSILAKYRAERDKRLRADGNDQYVETTGSFAHLLDDPYTPRVERPPVTDHVTFAMVGGGFAGLCVGARLVEAGITDVRIIDKAGDFGGNWYWNRYPGAQCDTASIIYLPLLEETGHIPTEKYAHAPEILEQSKRIGRTFGLYDKALFHTRVIDMVWDEARSVWLVTTAPTSNPSSAVKPTAIPTFVVVNQCMRERCENSSCVKALSFVYCDNRAVTRLASSRFLHFAKM